MTKVRNLVFGRTEGEEGNTHGRRRAGHEDQAAQVGRSLVAEGAGGVDQGADSVRLDGRADERRTPGCRRRCGFLGLDKFLGRVGPLGAVVGVAEDGSQDGQRGRVVEDGAQGNRRWLDGWKVWWEQLACPSCEEDSWIGIPTVKSGHDERGRLKRRTMCG